MILATATGVAGITAGGTLFAAAGLAFVTLRTTNRRLSAESARQRRELAHDRELADIADLRSLLDEAAIMLDEAEAAVVSTSEKMKPPFDDAGNLGDHPDDIDVVAEQEVAILSECILRLDTLTARLSIRLGEKDPVTEAFREARMGVVETRSAILFERYGDVDLASMKLSVSISAFYTRAVAKVGTFVDTPDTDKSDAVDTGSPQRAG
jgi:hypothetical protein